LWANGAATDIFDISGGAFLDFCMVCGSETRSPPFCMCNDPDGADFEMEGEEHCQT